MDELVNAAINERTWAVVGASNDRTKFGNRIYRDLRAAGYHVYPVNPSQATVEGDPAYATVRDLPERATVIDVVVPARIGLTVVDDAVEAGSTYFWLQPGAESPELIERATAAGLHVIYDRCAMVEKRTWPSEAGGHIQPSDRLP